MTAPSDHPTPGSALTEGDVPKLRKGDVLRCVEPGGSFSADEVCVFESSAPREPDRIYISGRQYHPFLADRFTFVSRPQPVSVSEHVAGDAVSGAVERLQKYLRERSKMRQVDPEEIHGLHIGDPREACLTASDIRSILAEIADLKARNKALEEGLRPFAELAADGHSAGAGMNDPLSKWLRVADLQTARTLTEADHGR